MTTVLPFVIGWLVLLAFVFAIIRGIRNRRAPSPAAPPRPPRGPDPTLTPYIRGTDLYRRSFANRDVAAPARIALGLPPQHHDAMWRDPPG